MTETQQWASRGCWAHRKLIDIDQWTNTHMTYSVVMNARIITKIKHEREERVVLSLWKFSYYIGREVSPLPQPFWQFRDWYCGIQFFHGWRGWFQDDFIWSAQPDLVCIVHSRFLAPRRIWCHHWSNRRRTSGSNAMICRGCEYRWSFLLAHPLLPSRARFLTGLRLLLVLWLGLRDGPLADFFREQMTEGSKLQRRYREGQFSRVV